MVARKAWCAYRVNLGLYLASYSHNTGLSPYIWPSAPTRLLAALVVAIGRRGKEIKPFWIKRQCVFLQAEFGNLIVLFHSFEQVSLRVLAGGGWIVAHEIIALPLKYLNNPQNPE